MARNPTSMILLVVSLFVLILLVPQVTPGERRASASNGDSLFRQLKDRTESRPTMELQVGTRLHVRLREKVTDRNRAGDSFIGQLDRPLIRNGRTLAPAGTRVIGRLTRMPELTAAHKETGSNEVGMVLEQIVLNNKVLELRSEPLTLLIPARPNDAETSSLLRPFRDDSRTARGWTSEDDGVIYESGTRLTFVLAERVLLPVLGRSE
ncbi:MAG: hypothetical protein EHM61_03205 [Acidobacteria bacterium]|nr:MAG: hypothetical protein EHM61_03205 [Acidobacteriota bacterium]